MTCQLTLVLPSTPDSGQFLVINCIQIEINNSSAQCRIKQEIALHYVHYQKLELLSFSRGKHLEIVHNFKRKCVIKKQMYLSLAGQELTLYFLLYLVVLPPFDNHQSLFSPTTLFETDVCFLF